jgi:hypothetical protein
VRSEDIRFTTKAGRTRTDKIGVGAGDDIGGTDISCNPYGQAVFVADTTKFSGRPPTCRRDAGNPLDKYAGLARTRLLCNLTLFCSVSGEDMCLLFVPFCNRSFVCSTV